MSYDCFTIDNIVIRVSLIIVIIIVLKVFIKNNRNYWEVKVSYSPFLSFL